MHTFGLFIFWRAPDDIRIFNNSLDNNAGSSKFFDKLVIDCAKQV